MLKRNVQRGDVQAGGGKLSSRRALACVVVVSLLAAGFVGAVYMSISGIQNQRADNLRARDAAFWEANNRRLNDEQTFPEEVRLDSPARQLQHDKPGISEQDAGLAAAIREVREQMYPSDAMRSDF